MNTKPYLMTLLASFVLVILGSFAGGVLRSGSRATIEKPGPGCVFMIKVFFFLLFGIMVFSLVPVGLHLFLFMQVSSGNGDLAVIRWLVANEPFVVYTVWGFFVAGMVLALPAAIKGGLLK